MPYFAAAYCGARALPRTITVEPMLTIDPPPSCSSMREPNSCVHISVPLMSTARVWSIDSSVMSRHDICSLAMSPTLLTSTSSCPNRSAYYVSHQPDLRPVDDVGLDEERLAPLGLDSRDGLPRARLGAAVMNGDVGAFLRCAHRDLGTEAGARAGDEDGLAGEPLGESHDVRGPY